MSGEAWGRWGAEDEVGALNQIGAEQVRHAAGLVRQGRVLSLAQPISSAMPVPQHRSGPAHFMLRDGGDYAAGGRRPGGFQFAEDAIMLPLHAGTHVDALCHCWYDDQLYNGFSGHEVRSRGAARCGMEKMPPTVCRGVLLDCTDSEGRLPPDGMAIDADALDAVIERSGVSIEPGDAVLLRTGWLERQEGAAMPDFNREPGIDESAALLLAQRGAALVGADNFAVEVLPFAEGMVFPVHQRLIRDHGIPLLEGLVLRELAAVADGPFLFILAPLAIVGASGSPATPLAVL